MPRDLPDWDALTAQSTVHEVTDIGELAVRLGSIVSHDRRGDVIFIDSFEDGLNSWSVGFSGAGGVVDLTTDWKKNGLFAVRLIGGSDVLRLANIVNSRAFPVLSRFGLEMSFRIVTTIESLNFFILLYNGTSLITGQIRWRDAEKDLQYLSSSGAFVTFATSVDLTSTQNMVHTAKIVIDVVNENYARFILNEVEYSLEDIGLNIVVDSGDARLTTLVRLNSRAGANDEVNLDDAIITQNEPV